MKKAFFLMCIVMSLVCMMACAMTLAMKTQGIPVEVLGMTANASLVGGLLMLFAVLFLLLPLRVVLKMRKK